MTASHIPDREIAERPDRYAGPNLSPNGLRLAPHRLGDGVHALLATIPPKDNNGVITGTRATLIVDAGITPTASVQIRSRAAELTDISLRYLVNTTYHGDHTFGNASFPETVTIVSSLANKANMTDLAYEKRVRAGNMYGDEALLDDVTTWRQPDITFTDHAEIDLGDRTVQLWHFGPGNGPGDTIVYEPDTRTAWTGNFLCHAGVAHMLLQGGPKPYITSLRRMKQHLPRVERIVPGHGPMGDAIDAIDTLIGYLTRLDHDVSTAWAAGLSATDTETACFDPWADGLDRTLADAMATYPLPPGVAQQGMLALCRNLHRLNILATYRLHESGHA